MLTHNLVVACTSKARAPKILRIIELHVQEDDGRRPGFAAYIYLLNVSPDGLCVATHTAAIGQVYKTYLVPEHHKEKEK